MAEGPFAVAAIASADQPASRQTAKVVATTFGSSRRQQGSPATSADHEQAGAAPAHQSGSTDQHRQPLHASPSRAGALAAIAAARKQALAAESADEAAQLTDELSSSAAVAEEAQAQLAMAQLELEDATAQTDHGAQVAANARVELWKSHVADAVARLRSLHTQASEAQATAEQAHVSASQAAAHAASVVAKSQPGAPDASAPNLSDDPAAMLQSMVKAASSLHDAWAAECTAAQAAVQHAEERAAAVQQSIIAHRDQAQIAAQQAMVLMTAGRAVDAGAAEAAAHALVQKAKCAAKDLKGAKAAKVAAQRRWDSAQEQLSRLAASRTAWDAEAAKLRLLLDTAADESRLSREQAAKAAAAARLASMRQAVALQESKLLSALASQLQAEVQAAEVKGDVHTLDALVPQLNSMHTATSRAAQAVAALSADVQKAQTALRVAQSSVLASQARSATARDSAMRASASAATSVRNDWHALTRSVSMARQAATATAELVLASAQAHSQDADAAHAVAREAEVAERFGDARASYARSRRLTSEAAQVRHQTARYPQTSSCVSVWSVQ